MKRLIIFFTILLYFFTTFSQATYFNSPFLENDEQKARLYSILITPYKVYATIELIPKKDMDRMIYWTTTNTWIKAEDIGLPLLGALSLDKKQIHTCNYEEGWGWNNVKKGRSYKYILVFAGTIPSGVTAISLVDDGVQVPSYDWLGNTNGYETVHSYTFANHTLNNPYTGEAPFSTENSIIKNINENSGDPFVGIYEGTGNVKYKLGCIKLANQYVFIYMSNHEKLSWWKMGDTKAFLKESATQGLFKADWIMKYKSIETNAYIIFDSAGMKTIINNDENYYIKMYPKSSTSVVSEADTKIQFWSGTGFAISDKYIATNNHVIDKAQSITVQGIKGDFDVKYNAKIVITDPTNDLTLIEISDEQFTGFGHIPYKIKTNTSEVGENIYVLGYPMTTTMGEEIKLTTGVISSKTGFLGDASLYQISAPIQPGNSGGPLFDSKGNIVGIVNAKHTQAENASYAIKTSYLKNLVENITSKDIFPKSNKISSLSLTDKVKIEKDFVYMIKCSNRKGVNPPDYNTPSNQSAENIIYNPPCNSIVTGHLIIRSIELKDDKTIINFNYTDFNGPFGWCSINPDCYIIANGKNLKMIAANGIAQSPKTTTIAHRFQTIGFSLEFPAIPTNTQAIDFIESSNSEWNITNIQLK